MLAYSAVQWCRLPKIADPQAHNTSQRCNTLYAGKSIVLLATPLKYDSGLKWLEVK